MIYDKNKSAYLAAHLRAIALITLLLISNNLYANLICKISTKSGQAIVTLQGKNGEFESLLNAGERREALFCCVSCLAPNGSKVIIMDQGFFLHTIRIIDGKEKGCTGEIPVEFLTECK